jgi:alginate O-acetyltransferase complex protein AlgI
MNTASLHFLGFAAIAACLYNLHSPVWWRQGTLFVANLLFLATFAPSLSASLPFAGFLALGYLGIQIGGKTKDSRIFVVFLVLIIGVFVWLKKYAFLPAHSFLQFSYLTIGLSYILFRVSHVMIDANSVNLTVKINPISYLNYTLNFMTLVSGPIQRYEDFASTQLSGSRPSMNIFSVGEGLHRIVVGFFKVAVLSWMFSLLQKEAIRALPVGNGFREKVWIGAIIAVLYPLYLYFNFSGYTDMMIGIGRFFRFTLPENFDRPFAADNIMKFWSRWHMTLTNWLKTYVFNPLLMALMRRVTSPAWEPFLVVPALFVTFFLIGLWHGQTTEFLMFGFLQGFGIAVNQLYQILLEKQLGKTRFKAVNSNPVYVAISRGLTFTWFTFTLLWFWTTWKTILWMFQILSFQGVALALFLILLAATAVLGLYEALRERLLAVRWNGMPLLHSRYSCTVLDTCLVAASMVVVVLLNAPAPEIIYKAF